jgi:hypothetical protein
MTNEAQRMRRHLRALATVNRQLQAQLETTGANPRSSVASTWVEMLHENTEASSPYLVRRSNGTKFLIEGSYRRDIRSGQLAAALAQLLGEHRDATDEEVDGWIEGPPVEIMESPRGAPFIVVGGHRLPIRGLPLPYPVTVAEMESFPQGSEINLGAVVRGVPTSTHPRARVPLPTFLIIGAQKSATRWLRMNLGLHPDIFAASGEPSFFSSEERFRGKGVEWYRTLFEDWSGESVVGESTPGYMMWRHHPEVIAERIEGILPDVRLIAIVRNPIDRAYSAMIHHIEKERLPAGADLLELVRRLPPEDDDLGLVTGGWYASSLRPYVEHFGDNLLVLVHDDLRTDPLGVYSKALMHVGASSDFVPSDLDRIRFSNLQGSNGSERLSLEDRLELYDYFRDEVHELERMIGRDLSAWEPNAHERDGSLDAAASSITVEPEVVERVDAPLELRVPAEVVDEVEPVAGAMSTESSAVEPVADATPAEVDEPRAQATEGPDEADVPQPADATVEAGSLDPA